MKKGLSIICPNCDGSGKIHHDVQIPYGFMRRTKVCPVCKGMGKTKITLNKEKVNDK